MGSFNHTCHISGLPITTDDAVKLFFISNDGFDHSGLMCYPHDQYRFCSFGIDAEYDDYGGFEFDENDPHLNYFLEYIRFNGVHVPKGENKYHDIEVDPKNMTLEMLGKGITEGRLLIKDFRGEHQQVRYYPILKSVYDRILGMPYTDYRGNVNDVKFYMDGARTEVENYLNRAIDGLGLKDEDLDEKLDFIKRNYVSCVASRIEHMSGTSELIEFVDGDYEHVYRQIAEMRMLYTFLHRTNISIQPRQTSGQELNYDEHAKFHKMIAGVARQKQIDFEIACDGKCSQCVRFDEVLETEDGVCVDCEFVQKEFDW